MLGFSEREVKHWTFKKWSGLYNYYKKFHNFKVQQMLFDVEPTEEEQMESLEWFKD